MNIKYTLWVNINDTLTVALRRHEDILVSHINQLLTNRGKVVKLKAGNKSSLTGIKSHVLGLQPLQSSTDLILQRNLYFLS